MIYLIGKIFFYLLFALAGGAAAGWLWRNMTAQAREQELLRDANDARGRLPQLESLMRTRDDAARRMTEEMEVLRKGAREAEQAVRQAEREVETLKREAKQAQSGGAVPVSDELVPLIDDDDAHQGEEVAVLRRRIAELEAAAQTGSLATLSAEDDDDELTELKAAHEQLKTELDEERRRVSELERERDLQNKSLKVLHQQLEMERERPRARAVGSPALQAHIVSS